MIVYPPVKFCAACLIRATKSNRFLERDLATALKALQAARDRLVELYGQLQALDPRAQLSTAEGWLEQQSTNPYLLLTLGRLSLRNNLWGKAQSYLEASIGAGPLAATYQELGALLEKMDAPKQALDSYREGLRLTSGSSPLELPDKLMKQPLANAPQIEQPQPGIVM